MGFGYFLVEGANEPRFGLLAGERQLSYREIIRILAMPVGSIGPTRARSLARLRATAAVRDYVAC